VEEFIDEVDKTGKVIATHPKNYLKERMFLHQVVLIIPRSKDGKYLLSLRAKDKYPFPDSWCCAVGGKVNSGETIEEAAFREMKEEIGVTYPVKKVASFLYDKPEYKAIFTVFTTTVIVSPTELKLDPQEIQYSDSLPLNEILKLVEQTPDKFSPTFIAAIKEFAKNIAD
jgi:isopentenyl-diphosphate Delta-isomerase